MRIKKTYSDRLIGIMCEQTSDDGLGFESLTIEQWKQMREKGDRIADEIEAKQEEVIRIKEFNPDTKQFTLEVILPVEAYDYVKSQAVLQRHNFSGMLYVMIKHYEWR